MSTQPPGEPPPVVEVAPVGDVEVVAEGPDVPFVAVEEYYFVGDRYYYWHPGLNRYVMLRGHPPDGYRISRMEHLVAHDRIARTVGPGPAVRRPAAPQPQPQQKKAQPNQKEKKKPDNQ